MSIAVKICRRAFCAAVAAARSPGATSSTKAPKFSIPSHVRRQTEVKVSPFDECPIKKQKLMGVNSSLAALLSDKGRPLQPGNDKLAAKIFRNALSQESIPDPRLPRYEMGPVHLNFHDYTKLIAYSALYQILEEISDTSSSTSILGATSKKDLSIVTGRGFGARDRAAAPVLPPLVDTFFRSRGMIVRDAVRNRGELWIPKWSMQQYVGSLR